MTQSILFEYFTVLSSNKIKMNYINKYAVKIKEKKYKVVASFIGKKKKLGHA